MKNLSESILKSTTVGKSSVLNKIKEWIELVGIRQNQYKIEDDFSVTLNCKPTDNEYRNFNFGGKLGNEIPSFIKKINNTCCSIAISSDDPKINLSKFPSKFSCLYYDLFAGGDSTIEDLNIELTGDLYDRNNILEMYAFGNSIKFKNSKIVLNGKRHTTLVIVNSPELSGDINIRSTNHNSLVLYLEFEEEDKGIFNDCFVELFDYMYSKYPELFHDNKKVIKSGMTFKNKKDVNIINSTLDKYIGRVFDLDSFSDIKITFSVGEEGTDRNFTIVKNNNGLLYVE